MKCGQSSFVPRWNRWNEVERSDDGPGEVFTRASLATIPGPSECFTEAVRTAFKLLSDISNIQQIIQGREISTDHLGKSLVAVI